MAYICGGESAILHDAIRVDTAKVLRQTFIQSPADRAFAKRIGTVCA